MNADEQHPTRYRELEKVVESLLLLDVTDKSLPVSVSELRRRGKKALEFKEKPRNTNLDGAREIARENTLRRAKEFREKVAPAIAQAQGEGAKTVREIADALNKAGFRTSRGGEWSAGTVFRFLGED
jgi:hypothetical protein